MMLIPPRVIAVDDDRNHLDGLARALNQYGVACLQFHFTGDTTGIKSCPSVRVIFADLHLVGSTAPDHAKDFSTIGGLIQETIKPSGPYFIVLWTRYPDQATGLQDFLEHRLKDVTKPFAVLPIDKSVHLDIGGNVKSVKKLVETIADIAQKQPQIAALLNWEDRVLGAAADTVSSILILAEPTTEAARRAEEVGRLLARLAVEAVGRKHVEQDRFRAVNEALLPILADRISVLRSADDANEAWKEAFSEADLGRSLSPEEAAKLNRFVHIEASIQGNSGAERGSVIPLPDNLSGEKFEGTFGLKQENVAKKQLGCNNFLTDDERFQWVLVQSQAACDYAQRQPGPLPFYLGLDIEVSTKPRDKPPAALWTSPPFEISGRMRVLRVSARFQVSIPIQVAETNRPIYRLRDQLLVDLVHHIHTYGSRPGMISFHGSKAKSKPKPNE